MRKNIKAQAMGRSRAPRKSHVPRVRTNAGLLPRLGVNEWGKIIVQCPRCGGRATTGRTGDVWCRDCGYTSAGLSGCG